jgi:endonuclease YncB( thermonuclease family)
MSAAAPFRAVILLAIALLSPPAAAKAPPFDVGETVAATAVLDGGEVALEDGRHVAPLGILLPRGREPEADTAREALAARLVGRTLELRFDGNRRDRHGRIVAHLFIAGRWLEDDLVKRGLARVMGSAEHRRGLAELLRSEAQARRARRGLWRAPAYAVRRAEDAGQHAGAFALIEGKVVDVGRGEGALFLDFADGHRGFRLRFSPDALRFFRAEATDPEALIGRRIRARGFVHGSERPTIDVTYPEQLERVTRSAKKSPGQRAGARRSGVRSIYG